MAYNAGSLLHDLDLEADDAAMAEVASHAAADEHTVAAAEAIQFCDYWPAAKSALQFLKDHVVTGGAPWKRVIRWGIGKGIDLGEKYYANSCTE